jgi:hypothetical protein
MTQLGFEPTIPMFEQTKTVHALDRAATVIGTIRNYEPMSEPCAFFRKYNYMHN